MEWIRRRLMRCWGLSLVAFIAHAIMFKYEGVEGYPTKLDNKCDRTLDVGATVMEKKIIETNEKTVWFVLNGNAIPCSNSEPIEIDPEVDVLETKMSAWNTNFIFKISNAAFEDTSVCDGEQIRTERVNNAPVLPDNFKVDLQSVFLNDDVTTERISFAGFWAPAYGQVTMTSSCWVDLTLKAKIETASPTQSPVALPVTSSPTLTSSPTDLSVSANIVSLPWFLPPTIDDPSFVKKLSVLSDDVVQLEFTSTHNVVIFENKARFEACDFTNGVTLADDSTVLTIKFNDQSSVSPGSRLLRQRTNNLRQLQVSPMCQDTVQGRVCEINLDSSLEVENGFSQLFIGCDKTNNKGQLHCSLGQKTAIDILPNSVNAVEIEWKAADIYGAGLQLQRNRMANFIFNENVHDVWEFNSKTAFDSCDFSQASKLPSTAGVVRVFANDFVKDDPDTDKSKIIKYYACSRGTDNAHCKSAKQKIKIELVNEVFAPKVIEDWVKDVTLAPLPVTAHDRVDFLTTSGPILHTLILMKDRQHFEDCDFTDKVNSFEFESDPTVGRKSEVYVDEFRQFAEANGDSANTASLFLACDLPNHCKSGQKIELRISPSAVVQEGGKDTDKPETSKSEKEAKEVSWKNLIIGLGVVIGAVEIIAAFGYKYWQTRN